MEIRDDIDAAAFDESFASRVEDDHFVDTMEVSARERPELEATVCSSPTTRSRRHRSAAHRTRYLECSTGSWFPSASRFCWKAIWSNPSRLPKRS